MSDEAEYSTRYLDLRREIVRRHGTTDIVYLHDRVRNLEDASLGRAPGLLADCLRFVEEMTAPWSRAWDEAEAYAEQLRRLTSPRPMQEAPRDGSWILIFSRMDGLWYPALWETEHMAFTDGEESPVEIYWARDWEEEDYTATAWLPMPQDPIKGGPDAVR